MGNKPIRLILFPINKFYRIIFLIIFVIQPTSEKIVFLRHKLSFFCGGWPNLGEGLGPMMMIIELIHS